MTLRLPDDLDAELRAAAEAAHTSINSVVVEAIRVRLAELRHESMLTVARGVIAKDAQALPTVHFATAAFYVDLLTERGPLLGEPYTRQLDGKLRELRFHLDGDPVRVTYWIASGRRTVLLTVFTKTRMREDREIGRARRALARCVAQAHTVDEHDGEASDE